MLRLSVPPYITELRKIIGLLSDDSPVVRNRGLIEMMSFLDPETQSSKNWNRVFRSCSPVLLRSLGDSCPINRQLAVEIMHSMYLDFLPRSSGYLAPLWPILTARLTNSGDMEPVQNLRAELLHIIYDIVCSYKDTTLNKFAHPTVAIIQQMCKEDHPIILKRICDITLKLFEKSTEAMTSSSTLIIRSLVESTCVDMHIHEDIARCISSAVMNNHTDGMFFGTKWMAERALDISPIMRVTVLQLIKKWATVHVGRFQYFDILIPILIIGLNDEVDGVGKVALEIWNEVGIQYKKDCYDNQPVPPMYLVSLPPFYPQYLIRPSLGCRLLIRHYMIKMVPALLLDLESPRRALRRCGAQVLCTLILHAEQDCVVIIRNLLMAMCEVARDKNVEIVSNVTHAAGFIGYFVQASSWWNLFLQTFEKPAHSGHFVILDAMMTTTNVTCLKEITPEILGHLNSQSCFDFSDENLFPMLLKCKRILREKTDAFSLWNPELKKVFSKIV